MAATRSRGPSASTSRPLDAFAGQFRAQSAHLVQRVVVVDVERFVALQVLRPEGQGIHAATEAGEHRGLRDAADSDGLPATQIGQAGVSQRAHIVDHCSVLLRFVADGQRVAARIEAQQGPRHHAARRNSMLAAHQQSFQEAAVTPQSLPGSLKA